MLQTDPLSGFPVDICSLTAHRFGMIWGGLLRKKTRYQHNGRDLKIAPVFRRVFQWQSDLRGSWLLGLIDSTLNQSPSLYVSMLDMDDVLTSNPTYA